MIPQTRPHRFAAALRIAEVAVLLLSTALAAAPASAATSCPNGATLNIVAHEDDDLLFLSPDLLGDVQPGRCVRTVFLTAGDAGEGSSYWSTREAGSKAAYAKMAGVSNSWTKSDLGVSGHSIPLYTLTAKTTVSLAFLRLPDGAMDGSGFDTYGNESLQKLWDGSIDNITPDNGGASYSRAGLISALTSVMTKFQPGQIHTQNYVGDFDDGDHNDHHAAAYFARAAHQNYTTPHTLTGYLGYPGEDNPANVSGANLTTKKSAFYKYAGYDTHVCSSNTACEGSEYALWLARQYTVGSETGGSNPAPTPTPTPTPSPSPSPSPAPLTNVARTATATASSQDTSTGQLAGKANDGVVAGWPGDYTKEWATVGGGAGSWLNLAWSAPQSVTKIVLHDRPNLDDQITAATITFSDGSTLTVPALTNDGTGVTLTFPAKTITSLRLGITGVSGNTYNVGLSEIEVY